MKIIQRASQSKYTACIQGNPGTEEGKQCRRAHFITLQLYQPKHARLPVSAAIGIEEYDQTL